MNWYRGVKPVAGDNVYLTGSCREVIEDAEYYGKNITQSLDIEVDYVKEGEKVFCCAKQVNTEICKSIPLDPFRSTCEYVLAS